MAEQQEDIDLSQVLARFPDSNDRTELEADKTNPAIRLYGRRFYKDQTPVEYLAEFLLVFASPKTQSTSETVNFCYQFNLGDGQYFPEDRVALKLFAFFTSSKLETRHPVHRQAYLEALEELKKQIIGTEKEKDETVRLLQSLLGGFVGVAKDRTWVTCNFLPASTSLLSREVTWKHIDAIKSKKGLVTDWESSKIYFESNTRNFMGRGGELLFLQLVNLFSQQSILEELNQEEYKYLTNRFYSLDILKISLAKHLQSLLRESLSQLGGLVKLIEDSLKDFNIKKDDKTDNKPSNFGWVVQASCPEAFLFAVEMDNICSSNIGTLDKLDLLQTLCCMQVLRSLCFQARRLDTSEKTTSGFIGNYVWVVTDSNANLGTPIRQMAQTSFNQIDSLLYRVLRSSYLNKDNQVTKNDLENGDNNTFKLFRKFSKEIGLVIPAKGTGQRFTLPQNLLRFLIAALLQPGERIRLNHFYERVFAHYGIALGDKQLGIALNWCGYQSDIHNYAVSSNNTWVEEALQQGGFLVELSDAVSMVKNPG